MKRVLALGWVMFFVALWASEALAGNCSVYHSGEGIARGTSCVVGGDLCNVRASAWGSVWDDAGNGVRGSVWNGVGDHAGRSARNGVRGSVWDGALELLVRHKGNSVEHKESFAGYDWARVDSLVIWWRFASAEELVRGYYAEADRTNDGLALLNAAFYLSTIDYAVHAMPIDSAIARYSALAHRLQGGEGALAGVFLLHCYRDLIYDVGTSRLQRNPHSDDPSQPYPLWSERRVMDSIAWVMEEKIGDLSALAELEWLGNGLTGVERKLMCVEAESLEELELTLVDGVLTSLDNLLVETLQPPSGAVVRPAMLLPLTALAEVPLTDSMPLMARFSQRVAARHRSDAPATRLHLDRMRWDRLADLYSPEEWIAGMDGLIAHYEGLEVEHADMAQLYLYKGRGLERLEKRKEAHDVYAEAEQRYPLCNEAGICRTHRLALEEPWHSVTVDKIAHTQRNRMALVRYRNVSEILFRVVATDLKVNAYTMRQKVVDSLQKLPAFMEWRQALPCYDDYQMHQALIALPMLPLGEYVLLSSDATDSTGAPSALWGEGNICMLNIVSCDAMFLTHDQRGNKNQLLHTTGWLVDRATGMPIAHQKVGLEWGLLHKSRKSDRTGYFDLHTERNLFLFHFNRDRIYVDYGDFQFDDDGFGIDWLYNNHLSRMNRETILLDRPLYKLGDEVQFSVLTYEGKLQRKNWRYDFAPISGKKLTALLIYGRDILAQQELVTDEWGLCSGSFTLPTEGRNGSYRLRIRGRHVYTSKNFPVEAYKPPRFMVSLAGDGKEHHMGCPITVKGRATAYNGSSMEGCEVHYFISVVREDGERDRMMDISGEVVADREGNFAFDFVPTPLDNAEGNFTYEYDVAVDVVSSDGESHQQYIAFRVGRFNAYVDAGDVQEGKMALVYNDIDHNPMEGSLRVRLERLQQPACPRRPAPLMKVYPEAKWVGSEEEFHQLFPQYAFSREEWDSTLWKPVALVLDSVVEGRSLTLPDHLASGSYRLTLWANDSIRKVRIFEHHDPTDPRAAGSRLLTVTEKQPRNWGTIPVQLGDTIKVSFASAYPNQPVYYRAACGNRTLASGMMVLNAQEEADAQCRAEGDDLAKGQKGSSAEVKEMCIIIPVTEQLGDQIVVCAAAVREGECSIFTGRYSKAHPDDFLPIKTEHFKDKLQPGEQEQWSFCIENAQQNRANLWLTMYDESLDQMPLHVFNQFNVSHSASFGMCFSYQKVERVDMFGCVSRPRKVFTPDLSLMRKGATMYWPKNYFFLMNRFKEERDSTEEAFGTLEISVINDNFPEALPFATVALKKKGMKGRSLQPDFDGRCIFKKLEEGSYTLRISMVGYEPLEQTVEIKTGIRTTLGISMTPSAVALYSVAVRSDKIPVLEIESPASGLRLTSDDIARMPGNSVESIVATLGGVGYDDGTRGETGSVSLEGDVRKRGGNVPKDAIAEIMPLYPLESELVPESAVLMRKSLNTSAFFMPSLHTDDSGRVRITFTAPDALSSWHLSGFAWSQRMQIGTIDRMVKTQKELMVLPQVPRFFRQGDTIDFRTKVSNLSDSLQQVLVSLEMRGAQQGEVFCRQQSSTTVNAHGSSTVQFRLVIPDSLHVAQYRIVARSRDFSDGEQAEVPVLSRRQRVTESLMLCLNGPSDSSRAEKHYRLDALTAAGANDSLTLLMCSHPIWYALDAAPHFAWHFNPSSLYRANRLYVNAVEYAVKENTSKMALKLQLQKLEAEQQWDGGWSWMPSNRKSDPYVTRRILQRLGEVAPLYPEILSTNMIKRGCSYMKQELMRMDSLIQANPRDGWASNLALDCLYSRSLLGFEVNQPDSCTRSIYRHALDRRGLTTSLMARAELTLIAFRMGDTAIARDEAIRLKECALVSDEMGMYWRDNTWGLGWWERPLETQALMVDVMAEVLQDWASVAKLQQWMLKQRQTTTWQNDMATAYAIQALTRGPQAAEYGRQDWEVEPISISVAGSELSARSDSSKYGFFEEHWGGSEAQRLLHSDDEVVLSRNTPGVSWGALFHQYEADLEMIPHHDMGIRMEKKLYRVERDQSLTLITDSTVLQVGNVVKVQLLLHCDRTLEYLTLTDQRAATFEPVSVNSGWCYNDGLRYYVDMRNEESRFYIDRVTPGEYLAEYSLRVMASGSFANGIATLESSFAPEFRSNTASCRIRVAE